MSFARFSERGCQSCHHCSISTSRTRLRRRSPRLARLRKRKRRGGVSSCVFCLPCWLEIGKLSSLIIISFLARGDGQEGVTRSGKQASQLVRKKARTVGGRKSSPVSVKTTRKEKLVASVLEEKAKALAKAFARLNGLYEWTGTAKHPPSRRTLYPEVWCYLRLLCYEHLKFFKFILGLNSQILDMLGVWFVSDVWNVVA